VEDFVTICMQILLCRCDKYEISLGYEELDQLSLVENKEIQFFLLKINRLQTDTYLICKKSLPGGEQSLNPLGSAGGEF
jgi:hypothetical protein